MNTDKVTIVLAMYKPNLIWLAEQLKSLNEQEYSNLELLVWNDNPDEKECEKMFSIYITKFPFQIVSNKMHLGSSLAFEKLTKLAKGKYIAYCDQDDVWHKDKISKSIFKMKRSNATMVCSDMRVIDEGNNIIANKICEVRPRQTFVKQEKQIDALLVRNFVTGCTIVAERETAQKAIPFPSCFVHDRWLALWNALHGKLVAQEESLIDYRIHGNNQTGVLKGINSKEDYFNIRCKPYYEGIKILYEMPDSNVMKYKIKKKYLWAKARTIYLKQANFSHFIQMLLLGYSDWRTTIFELLMPLLPTCFFNKIVKFIKNNNF